MTVKELMSVSSPRAVILGLGSYVPDRVVTNEEIPYLDQEHTRCEEKQMDTSDECI